mmetsp:Transcript_34367/g.77682  ORF Transcript_34367/g.77682 Transcript_34367/m.77682 type:complete len:228 (-) Transcript_34367:265-948(-)
MTSVASTYHNYAMKTNESLPDAHMPQFDSKQVGAIVRGVAAHYDLPVCFVALTGVEQMHLKARYGIWHQTVPNSLSHPSLCYHSVNRELPIINLDACKDARFMRDPLCVTAPCARFYAGAPIMLADRVCIGTLCIIDERPYTRFSLEQCNQLIEGARTIAGLYRNVDTMERLTMFTLDTLHVMEEQDSSEDESETGRAASKLASGGLEFWHSEGDNGHDLVVEAPSP